MSKKIDFKRYEKFVDAVTSEASSVPLNIISESPACASIVIFPEVVVKLTAASPAVKSSAAEDTPLVKYVLNVAALVTFIVPPSL